MGWGKYGYLGLCSSFRWACQIRDDTQVCNAIAQNMSRGLEALRSAYISTNTTGFGFDGGNLESWNWRN